MLATITVTGAAAVLAIGIVVVAADTSVELTLADYHLALREADGYFSKSDRFEAPLREAEVFASKWIGYGGELASVSDQFLRVLQSEQPEKEFLALAKTGASGARLYGLCGLIALGSAHVADTLRSLTADRRRVGIMGGCIFSVTTVQEYAASADFKSMCDELTSFNGAASLPNKPLNLTGPPP
jgi:hypothetical protein